MSDDKRLYDVSRRKLIAGLGTIGVASAGAGLGTTAFLNDTESFTGNSLTAGKLDLVVDWATDRDQGMAGSEAHQGQINGNPGTYTYEVTDVKPGDEGTIAFCPKIIDNPGWLWIGSEEGSTDYENGRTEPENVTDTSGGDPGAGAGELSANTMVDVFYADSVTVDGDEVICGNKSELKNPDGYTLADLAADLSAGFLLDADRQASGDQAYPASSGPDDQQGPCICVEWKVPTSVGNIIQTDSFTIDFSLVAEQERHNPDGNTSNPFNTS